MKRANYTLLPTSDVDDVGGKDFLARAFDYGPTPNYHHDFIKSQQFDIYRSIFTYNSSTINVDLFNKGYVKPSNSLTSLLCHYFLVMCCYTILTITAPFTIWFCIKKISQHERAIVFRLGRMQAIKEPGFTCIIPLIDKWKRVDLRMRAYSIPPQQLILADGVIVETGAEIRFRISDVIKSVTKIQNLEESVRSLGQSILVNILHHKKLQDVNTEKAILNTQIQAEMNLATAPWGLEVSQVEMAPVKVLHMGTGQPSPLGTLMSSLQEMLIQRNSNPVDETSWMSASRTVSSIPEADPVVNNAVYEIMVNKVFPIVLENGASTKSNNSDGAIYKLQVSGSAGGTFWLDTKRGLATTGEKPHTWENPDVTVTISAEDFFAILIGKTSPLQAYIGGHVQVTGNAFLLHNFQGILNKLPKESASASKTKDVHIV